MDIKTKYNVGDEVYSAQGIVRRDFSPVKKHIIRAISVRVGQDHNPQISYCIGLLNDQDEWFMDEDALFPSLQALSRSIAESLASKNI